MSTTRETLRPKPFWLNEPKIRSLIYQGVIALVVVALIAAAVLNARDNLIRQKIASGFGFWDDTSGFDISQRLITYTATSTYGRAFWVGLLNTLLVAAIGISLATPLGFTIGLMQLSKNWLIRQAGTLYVGLFRNVPLLLQLLFWYNSVLKALPDRVADSLRLPGPILINRRGLVVPEPAFARTFNWVLASVLFGIGATILLRYCASRRQAAAGRRSSVSMAGVGLIVGLPAVVFVVLSAASGAPISFDRPELGRFNINGGVQVYPEFVALLAGLTTYTAAYIAEIVRAGLQSVHKGQIEAAHSLGLRFIRTMTLVVIPQAMRVIIPPLTSQYLNLVKNSSLAVAIGYPDLFQVFTGTVLNQTGRAVEIVSVTMAVYLSISLLTSLAMNIYNLRKALVER